MGLGIASGLALACSALATAAARPVAVGFGAKVPPAQALHARPSLHLEHTSIAPGDTQWLAIRFEIDEHWHLYWDGYNDAGLPPKATWTLPEGFKVGPTQWPVPTRQVLAGEILNHIYERELVMLVPLTVPETAKPGEKHAIQADLSWLVCEEACVPESASVSVEVTIGAPGVEPAIAPASSTIFERARKAMPEAMTPETRAFMERAKPRIGPPLTGTYVDTEPPTVARFQVPEATSLTWFPGPECSAITNVIESTQAKINHMQFGLDVASEQEAVVYGMLQVQERASGHVRTYVFAPPGHEPPVSWLKPDRPRLGESRPLPSVTPNHDR
jgi:DsbC/DsbD-like thiol-disulfide interchange protein